MFKTAQTVAAEVQGMTVVPDNVTNVRGYHPFISCFLSLFNSGLLFLFLLKLMVTFSVLHNVRKATSQDQLRPSNALICSDQNSETQRLFSLQTK